MQYRTSPLLCGALALAVALAALLSPVSAAPAAQEVAPLACEEVQTLTLTGPTYGETDYYYEFQAAAGPPNATLDITYAWEITGSQPFYSSSGLTNIQEFAWNTPGPKTVTVSARAACANNPTASASLEIVIGPLPLAETPDEFRQRALLHLEEHRQSGQTSEWDYAYLGDAVRPLYRPDMAGPAYYEFAVWAPPSGAGASAVLPDEPAGFIVVSTGPHDYPIPNWATGGLPPTQRMIEAAQEEAKTAVRFFKLDPLSYAAEGHTGELVAKDGDMPHRITGIPDEWLSAPPPVTQIVSQPGAMFPTDPDGAPVTYTLSITNAVENNPVQLEGWDSWDELKDEYAQVYAPFLEAQQRAAELEWEIEEHNREYGHVLFKGDSLSFPLLWEGPAPVYSGPAWDLGLTTVQITDPGEGAARLVITAVDATPGQSQMLLAEISYGNGMTETLKVIVVHRAMLYLPLATHEGVGAVTPPPLEGEAASAGGWGVAPASDVRAQVAGTVGYDGYTYWYANGANQGVADAQQVWYGQYTGQDMVGDCRSGCGPTAWAMLIAWGDRMAANQTLPGSAIWAGRWGLYRTNGGRGADAVAPEFMGDAAQAQGVRNMTFEINGQLGTFCNLFNDNGATLPADMHRITQYLNGRSGMQVKTWHNPAGFDIVGSTAQSIAEMARNVIQNPMEYRRPSVIGIGFLSHYPLAYGYRQKPIERCTTTCTGFGNQNCTTTCIPIGLARGWYVNQGNAVPGKYGTNEWVSSDLFFAGRLSPHQAFVDDVGLYRASSSYFFLDYGHDTVHDRSIAPFGWVSGIRPTVGDFDRDGVLDDIAAFIWDTDVASWRRGWRIDYNADRSNDVFLNRWSVINDAWPMALDVDRDGWVDDLALYHPAIGGWSWNTDATPQTSPNGSCYYEGVYPNFPLDGRPVTGDFNRDGYHDDVGVFSPSRSMWYFDYRSNGCGIDRTSGLFGTVYDLPVAGDFDKDGFVDDIAVYSSMFYSGTQYGDRYWRYDYNADNTNMAVDKTSAQKYGSFGDLPIAGNWDTN
jgi:hypothetical protein